MYTEVFIALFALLITYLQFQYLKAQLLYNFINNTTLLYITVNILMEGFNSAGV